MSAVELPKAINIITEGFVHRDKIDSRLVIFSTLTWSQEDIKIWRHKLALPAEKERAGVTK